jgi:hypothetical protein
MHNKSQTMTTTKAILVEALRVMEVALCWMAALLVALPVFADFTLWERAAIYIARTNRSTRNGDGVAA